MLASRSFRKESTTFGYFASEVLEESVKGLVSLSLRGSHPDDLESGLSPTHRVGENPAGLPTRARTVSEQSPVEAPFT